MFLVFGDFQLEMVEVNLLQLRSVNELNKVDESNQNKGDDSDIKHDGNEQSKIEANDALKKENENQRLRINELTLYIQQAAEGKIRTLESELKFLIIFHLLVLSNRASFGTNT